MTVRLSSRMRTEFFYATFLFSSFSVTGILGKNRVIEVFDETTRLYIRLHQRIEDTHSSWTNSIARVQTRRRRLIKLAGSFGSKVRILMLKWIILEELSTIEVVFYVATSNVQTLPISILSASSPLQRFFFTATLDTRSADTRTFAILLKLTHRFNNLNIICYWVKKTGKEW